MSNRIRLDKNEINIITKAFLRYFDVKDHLWLFGSRADPSKRGGDLDLYIETYYDSLPEIAEKKINFLVDLKNEMGDQKIDVVIRIMTSQDNLPIYDEAKNSGVMLV
jgi:hypothetical protein